MGFIEVIKKGAITNDTIMNSDIFATLNHDKDHILARSRYGEGSLALELRDDGLYYEFEAPNTIYGDELIEHIKRGEITTSSFAFSLPKDGSGDKWYRTNDGITRRDITMIERLYDVSPVFEPAYLTTSCSQRALDMVSMSDEISKKMDSLMSDIEQYKI